MISSITTYRYYDTTDLKPEQARSKLNPFTCADYVRSWAFHGKIEFPMRGFLELRSCLASLSWKRGRLYWLGHVHRMDPTLLPRRVLLSVVVNAKRSVARLLLRFWEWVLELGLKVVMSQNGTCILNLLVHID